ncbi:MAG: aminoglycoside 6-adenylyltransferase [Chloroflexota bacterium]
MSWQRELVEQFERFFAADEAVLAVVLAGSLVTGKDVDRWSDVDLKVVLADEAIGRYFESVSWLEPFGELLGLESHEEPQVKTLRVILDRLRRVDFVFVGETVVSPTLFPQPARILWSKLPQLSAQVGQEQVAADYRPFSASELEKIADQFWFRLGTAVCKIQRNDLLIGLHLTLDCMRDCLVLQMIRRDRAKGVTIHRFGGWGNELVAQIPQEPLSAAAMLALLDWCAEIFDALAADLSPTYQGRRMLLEPVSRGAGHPQMPVASEDANSS